MTENSIVDEIHKIREEMLAEYGGDLSAMIRDSELKTEELRKAGRVVVTRSPRPVQLQRNATGTINADKPEPAGTPGGGGMGGIN